MKRFYSVNSEYGKLKALLLVSPHPAIGGLKAPVSVLHARKIDYPAALREFILTRAVYRKLGIKCHTLNARADVQGDARYNIMFTRDTFFMTPRGAVICRPAVGIRREEIFAVRNFFLRLRVPVISQINAPGTFEGADALWLSPQRVAVGVGNRTNPAGFVQLKKELALQGVECVSVPAPGGVIHLLGALQLFAPAAALLRIESAGKEVRGLLKSCGIKVTALRENGELSVKQAMNFLVISAGKIVMPAGCSFSKRIFERAGISIAAEIPVEQLVNAGGGPACAAGILSRA